jgi:hypothetical protein
MVLGLQAAEHKGPVQHMERMVMGDMSFTASSQTHPPNDTMSSSCSTLHVLEHGQWCGIA